MDNFVHLHVHSEYSLLDGACRVKELVSYVKELGQSAIAITDHGNVYSAIDFYTEAQNQGIKAIIGCEVYVAPRTRHDKEFSIDKNPYHLILLCENNEGYKNLIKMVSLSYIEGFYNKPRVDYELLKKYSKGLICLSGCVIGEVARNILNGDYQKAKDVALKMREIFGKDNYFLEIQNHGLESEIRALPMILKISQETGIPIVATNDAHYTKKSDAMIQDILMCIQTQSFVQDTNRMKFQTEEFYIKSYDEMLSLFKNVPEALENSKKIADRCNVSFEFGVLKLPKFEIDGVSNNVEYFRDMCFKGMYQRYGKNPSSEVVERLNYELRVITEMGYVDYFLIVWDYVRYAKDNNIPVGLGRGSGAGSLCAYCIGITGVDPIRYNLLFERFLNPERVSMPDFDIDFCIEGRQKVIDYVTNKYGSDRVAQIITFGTLGAKASIRDVGRVLGFSYNFCSKIANFIPNKLNITIDDALTENPEFRNFYLTNEDAKKIVDIAKRVEGMPRNTSTHAAGVIISAFPISDLVPIKKNDDVIVTQYTMGTLERLGLLKMDFLGLRNLTVIRDCENYIKEKNPEFDINEIPIDDIGVYHMLSKGKTLGVFQFESSGITDVLVRLVPKNIEDLIAVLSLYRPGPMDSIPKYIENRHHPERVTYKTPKLKDILSVTYGCIVYQEQVMEIFRSLANYSYGRADIVRRAMSKKKHDVMLQERESFIKGCETNGISNDIANDIFDEMLSFASYAFNKSHATCYAHLSYQTAYLRYHYFTEYMASLMSSVLSNTPKLMEYISECENEGVKVLSPHINESCEGFTVTNSQIRFGLLAIKNLGKGMIEKIVQERNAHGKYISIKDFCKRTKDFDINKKAIESLIKAGAFDNLGYNRREMLSNLDDIINLYQDSYHNFEIEGQLDLFGEMSSIANKDVTITPMEEYPTEELLNMEHETIGMYISGHPLKGYSKYTDILKLDTITSINDSLINRYPIDNVSFISYITDFKKHTTKNNSQMCFLTVEDVMQSMECVMFPNVYEQCKDYIIKDNVVFLNGRVSIKDDKVSIIVENLVTIENFIKNPCYYAKRFFKKLSISITSQDFEKTAELCSKLNEIKGNIPIEIQIIDKRQRFIPKSKPRTNFNQEVIDLLNDFKLEYNFSLQSY
ncbi:MAG: DNA polymerase III subunit alpha [Oscillospiraceae bacterium]